jgi:hypothetical protein
MSSTISLRMVRNMLRMSFCQIAYARGLFPEGAFRKQPINGLSLMTLGGESNTEESITFLKWVESGVFDALNRGFLEKCILVVTTESGQTCEAWSLSVVWLTDEDGNEYPSLRTSGAGKQTSQSLKRLIPTKTSVQRARCVAQTHA